jgi:NADH-quinone oxidoreductase subunit N
MTQIHLADMAHLAPELTLVIAAIVLVLLDLVLPKSISRNRFGLVSLLALAVSAAFLIARLDKPVVSMLYDSFRIDDFSNLIKLLLLVGTAFVILLSYGSKKEQSNPYLAEYYYLLLPATVGGMVMASATDLITLYVGLELLSITSYILVGIRTSSTFSLEAAMKYVILGGIASAFILYGMSFLYGLTGYTQIVLHDGANIVGGVMPGISGLDAHNAPLAYIAMFLLIGGFAFKIAAAPFQSYAPDVYQGAPSSVASYLAVVSKTAAFAVVARFLVAIFVGDSVGGLPLKSDMLHIVEIIAAVSMVVGNALALRQRNMKRLLAYSGVANTGYLLVPIGVAFGAQGVHTNSVNELLFYALAYMLMTFGAFTVVQIVARVNGSEEMSAFAGLYYRAPWTAIAMIVFVLSLAGLPISAGFIGKLSILLGAVAVKAYWLALVMLLTSVASFYYYFSIVRQMFMRMSEDDAKVSVPFPLGLILWITALGTIALGLFPNIVFNYLEKIIDLTADFFIL